MGNLQSDTKEMYQLYDTIKMHMSLLINNYRKDFLDKNFCDSLEIIYTKKLSNYPLNNNNELRIGIKNNSIDKNEYCKDIVNHYMERITIINDLMLFIDNINNIILKYINEKGVLNNLNENNANNLIKFYNKLLKDVNNTINYLINNDHIDIIFFKNTCNKFKIENKNKLNDLEEEFKKYKIEAKLMALKYANP